ncbi:MAG: hypothetical protein V3T17_16305 [Pseudomonadales bacterium]
MAIVNPRFLSQAVESRLLDSYQALEIYNVWKMYQSNKSKLKDLELPKVGEIAVELCYLNEEQKDQILKSLDVSRKCPKPHYDPVKHNDKNNQLTLKLSAPVVFVVCVIVLGYAYLTSNNDLDVVGTIASIIGFLCMIFIYTWPKGIEHNLKLRHYYRKIAMILILTAAFVIPYIIYHLPAATLALSEGDVINLLVALISFLSISLALSLFYCEMKEQEKWYVERRTDILSRQRTKVNRYLEQPEKYALNDVEEEILYAAGNAMFFNPWHAILNKIIWKKKNIGAVSIWYMKPSKDNNETFDFVSFAAPNAPSEVKELYKEAQKEHHPNRYNKRKFQESLVQCRIKNGKRKGVIDKGKYLTLQGRHEYVSLTGFVYENKSAKHENDASKCLALDVRYQASWEGASLSKEARDWVDFCSVAAYPVFEDTEGKSIIGVLVAFENIENGITAIDRGTLFIASRLLGLAYSGLTKI